MEDRELTASERPLLMKPTEAARLADVSTRTITRMCESGQVPAVKLRGAWRINRAEFLRLIGQNTDTADDTATERTRDERIRDEYMSFIEARKGGE